MTSSLTGIKPQRWRYSHRVARLAGYDTKFTSICSHLQWGLFEFSKVLAPHLEYNPRRGGVALSARIWWNIQDLHVWLPLWKYLATVNNLLGGWLDLDPFPTWRGTKGLLANKGLFRIPWPPEGPKSLYHFWEHCDSKKTINSVPPVPVWDRVLTTVVIWTRQGDTNTWSWVGHRVANRSNSNGPNESQNHWNVRESRVHSVGTGTALASRSEGVWGSLPQYNWNTIPQVCLIGSDTFKQSHRERKDPFTSSKVDFLS